MFIFQFSSQNYRTINGFQVNPTGGIEALYHNSVFLAAENPEAWEHPDKGGRASKLFSGLKRTFPVFTGGVGMLKGIPIGYGVGPYQAIDTVVQLVKPKPKSLRELVNPKKKSWFRRALHF